MTDTGETLRRSYEEGCIAAHALDLIGDRWALLVVRELMLGPRRFGALRSGLPGISANILTRRLGDLEAAGLLVRHTLPPPADVQAYALTAAGQGLRPVIEALCRWGAVQPGHDPSKFISPTALLLSMAAMIDRRAARAHSAAVGFGLGNDSFAASLHRGRLRVARADRPEGDLVFTGTANAMAAAVYGPLPLTRSVSEGKIRFAGDLANGQAFVDLFRLSV